MKTALQAVKAEAQVIQSLVHQTDDVTVQAANAAIQAVVGAINDALDALLDDTGMYLLLVPLPKKGLVHLRAASSNPDEPGSNYLQFPANNVLAGLPEDQASALRNTPLWQSILDPEELFIGGNAHFVKTLSESLFDPKDPDRPKFIRSDTWAYALMVAGAQDLAGVMTAATFLDRLFGQGQDANAVGASRSLVHIIPTDVSVTPSGREQGALIEWTPITPRFTLESYDQSVVVAEQYAIIRSEDFRSKTAMRVGDLFTSTLTAGAEGLYGAKVIQMAPYDGITSRWLDSSIVAGKTYYYHVAFKARLERAVSTTPVRPNATLEVNRDPLDTTEGPDALDLGWDKLSGGIEFRLPTHPEDVNARRMGQPPDWSRTPSLARLLPPLNRFVDKVQEQLRTFSKSIQTVATRNTQQLAFLDAEIDRYAAQVSEIEHYIGSLQDLVSSVNAGIYCTLGSGTGSIPFFLSSVTEKFNNTADTGRPPFDAGSEYVCGAVLLAVGPDPSRIQKALTAMTTLFQAATADSPSAHLLAGIESVATSLATVEQTLLDAITGGGQTDAQRATASQTFNDDMTPRPVGEGDAACDPVSPTTPTFNADGTPKT